MGLFLVDTKMIRSCSSSDCGRGGSISKRVTAFGRKREKKGAKKVSKTE